MLKNSIEEISDNLKKVNNSIETFHKEFWDHVTKVNHKDNSTLEHVLDLKKNLNKNSLSFIRNCEELLIFLEAIKENHYLQEITEIDLNSGKELELYGESPDILSFLSPEESISDSKKIQDIIDLETEKKLLTPKEQTILALKNNDIDKIFELSRYDILSTDVDLSTIEEILDLSNYKNILTAWLEGSYHIVLPEELDENPEIFIFNSIKEGNLGTLIYFISLGYNLEILNKDGHTPLIYSIINNQFPIFLFLLLKGVHVDAFDNKHKPALYYILEEENIGFLKVFLKFTPNINSDYFENLGLPSISSFMENNQEIKEILQKNYITYFNECIRHIDKDNHTFLYNALQKINFSNENINLLLYRAIEKGSKTTLDTIIDFNKLSFNKEERKNILFKAFEYKQFSTIKFIMEYIFIDIAEDKELLLELSNKIQEEHNGFPEELEFIINLI